MKENLGWVFNGQAAVTWGKDSMSLTKGAVVPENGHFTKVTIQRQFADGSCSRTEWRGEVAVAVGDIIHVDPLTAAPHVHPLAAPRPHQRRLSGL